MTNCNYNNTISQIDISSDSNIKIVKCNDSVINQDSSGAKITPYKSFKPTSSNDPDIILTPSYIKDITNNPSNLNPDTLVNKPISKINNDTLGHTINFKYNNIKEGFIADEYTDSPTGGLEMLGLLFISGLLGIIFYILFLLYPIFFWSKFISNPNNNLIDKYFRDDKNDLPYNIENNSNRQNGGSGNSYINNDQVDCNDYNFSGNSSKDLWSKINEFLNGFPYYFKGNKKVYEKYNKISSEYLIKVILLLVFPVGFYFICKHIQESSNIKLGYKIFILIMIAVLYIAFYVIVLLLRHYFDVDLMLEFRGDRMQLFDKEFKTDIILGIFYIGIPIFLTALGLFLFWLSVDRAKIIIPIIIGSVPFAILGLNSVRYRGTNDPTNKYDFRFTSVFRKAIFYCKQFLINSYACNAIGMSYITKKWFKILGDLINTSKINKFFVLFGHIFIPIILIIWVLALLATGLYNGYGTFFGLKRCQLSDNFDLNSFTRVIGLILFLFGGVGFSTLFTCIHLILHIFIYFIIPLSYPEQLYNVIKCNIKTLVFIFVFSLISTIWFYKLKKNIQFVPDTTLTSMTITFVVITIYQFVNNL